MNNQTKSIIIGGLVGGIVYASIMAGFDFADGQDFRVWRLIINFLFFGSFMGLMTRYNLKKNEKRKNN